jgi:PII-like signaling protein
VTNPVGKKVNLLLDALGGAIGSAARYLAGAFIANHLGPELLREESIQGATVVHSIEGYGAHKQTHTARILDLSGDLPIVITPGDLPEKIEAVVIPKLGEMIGEGLVTTEKVRIVIFRPPPRP